MQRDVEIEIEMVDKSGGFIGALWLNKNENAAVALVQEGLATVHSYSADTLPWSKQLYTAEVCPCLIPVGWVFCIETVVNPTRLFLLGGGKIEEAQREYYSLTITVARRYELRNSLALFYMQIWKDYDEEAEKEVQPVEEGDPAALKTEYLDIIISDVRTTNGLGFSVQILNTEGTFSLSFDSRLVGSWKGLQMSNDRLSTRNCFSRAIDERLLTAPQDCWAGTCWIFSSAWRPRICQVFGRSMVPSQS